MLLLEEEHLQHCHHLPYIYGEQKNDLYLIRSESILPAPLIPLPLVLMPFIILHLILDFQFKDFRLLLELIHHPPLEGS